MPNTDWQNPVLINSYIMAPPAFVPTERMISFGWYGMGMVNVTTQDQHMAPDAMVNEDA